MILNISVNNFDIISKNPKGKQGISSCPTNEISFSLINKSKVSNMISKQDSVDFLSSNWEEKEENYNMELDNNKPTQLRSKNRKQIYFIKINPKTLMS